jgi:ribonuclease HI
MQNKAKPHGKSDMPRVRIWTDGSCYPNPNGPGGWACILESSNGTRKEMSGHMPSSTNNRAEVTALIEALKALNRPCIVEWTTDSEYAISCLNEKTSKQFRKAKNQDLLLELESAVVNGGHSIASTWVRGHEGHPENERCDELALIARKIVPVRFAA